MIISIASQKGGIGKTSTAISLASGLAWQGKKVLLVDMDSQGNSSKVLVPNYKEIDRDETVYRTILEKKSLPIHKTHIDTLDVAPAHILLSDADIELTMALDHREARLKNQLTEVAKNYDYVFIDCPPALSWLTLNAFTASDEVIVIVAPGYFELDSIVQIMKTINQVQSDFNPKFHLKGLLFTMSDPTVNTKISLEIIRNSYKDLVFKTIVPRNTDLRDAHMNKTDIYSYSPKSAAALAYKKLINEIFNA
jgi:chromosome partitioning protein